MWNGAYSVTGDPLHRVLYRGKPPPPNMLKERIPTDRAEILEIRQLIEKLCKQITHNAVRGGISMNSKDTQRITDAIYQFKLSSVTIEKELSEWESQEDSERDLLIFLSIEA